MEKNTLIPPTRTMDVPQTAESIGNDGDSSPQRSTRAHFNGLTQKMCTTPIAMVPPRRRGSFETIEEGNRIVSRGRSQPATNTTTTFLPLVPPKRVESPERTIFGLRGNNDNNDARHYCSGSISPIKRSRKPIVIDPATFSAKRRDPFVIRTGYMPAFLSRVEEVDEEFAEQENQRSSFQTTESENRPSSQTSSKGSPTRSFASSFKSCQPFKLFGPKVLPTV